MLSSSSRGVSYFRFLLSRLVDRPLLLVLASSSSGRYISCRIIGRGCYVYIGRTLFLCRYVEK